MIKEEGEIEKKSDRERDLIFTGKERKEGRERELQLGVII